MNIIEFHQRFRRYCSLEEGLSISTIQAMGKAVKTFVKRTEIENINDMTVDILREFFYEGKERYQWSYWSYMNYYKYLKKFLNWCVGKGYIKKNPILEIKTPKKPQSLPRRLTHEQAQQILYSSFNYDWRYDFERSRNHAIIATFLYTGVRCKELIDMQLIDVNLNTGSILIRNGKGAKDRYIPIHHKLKYILKRYLDDRKKLKKESHYLFTSVRSNLPLNYKNIALVCQKISKVSGVKFTPHQLRHTFASIAIEQNIGLVQLKEILGHANISSTMIYLKITPNKLKESLNAIELI